MKIYVPTLNSNTDCVVIRDTNTLRVYERQPVPNSNINYTDYFIHSNYYSVSGTANFTQYSTIPTCVARSDLTTEYGYRVDFPQIMICTILMLGFGYLLISRLVRTLFIDWRYS